MAAAHAAAMPVLPHPLVKSFMPPPSPATLLFSREPAAGGPPAVARQPPFLQASSVFPGGIIPRSAWSTPAQQLLKYIPGNPEGILSTSAFDQRLRDDKGGTRIDADTRWGALSAYYVADDYTLNNPYPTVQGGANVPGFNALYTGRAQLLVLSHTKTLGASDVNDFHFSYLRDSNNLGQPVGGVGVSLAAQGFVTGPGTLGIVPLDPRTEGVENINFNTFTMGADPDNFAQINNTFEWSDNLSKIVRTHAIKAGVQLGYSQINSYPTTQLNGSFFFFGTETGNDFADFLLGTPSQYNQNELRAFYGRNRYAGIYAQDSWR